MFRRTTSPILNDNGDLSEGSIASLEKHQIGDLDQWLLIRGHHTDNPILFFIHGGPGAASIFSAKYYFSELEKHFIVVHWDQRGSGLSYSKHIPPESMNINQFVSDIGEIIELLLTRFNQRKLFLVGSSWGSILGMLAAHAYPEWLHAYASIGQIGYLGESVPLSYQYIVDKANAEQNPKAMKELAAISNMVFDKKFDITQRKWLTYYGAAIHQLDRPATLVLQIIKQLLTSSEYTFTDVWKRYLPGRSYSQNALRDEMMQTNLMELVPQLEIPVYFLMGRHDYFIYFEVAKRYFDSLAAPYKEWIWFDQCAHMLVMEDNDKFCNVLINKFIPLQQHNSLPVMAR